MGSASSYLAAGPTRLGLGNISSTCESSIKEVVCSMDPRLLSLQICSGIRNLPLL